MDLTWKKEAGHTKVELLGFGSKRMLKLIGIKKKSYDRSGKERSFRQGERK